MARIKYLMATNERTQILMYRKILYAFFLVLLIASPCFAAVDTHYVTQAGAGGYTGVDLSNAFRVSDFNNAAKWDTDVADDNLIGPGDTVYFSGTITTAVTPKGSGTTGNEITFDGYAAGDCDPINALCSSSAILQGGILITDGIDYQTIQDFRISPSTGTNPGISITDYPVQLLSEGITVQRNYVYDVVGALFNANKVNYLTVENNKMVGFGKAVDASQGFNIVSTNDYVIRGNELGHTGATNCTSANVIEVHQSNYGLIEYNDVYGAPQQRAVEIKEYGNHDVIVRFNKLHDNNPGGTYGGGGVNAMYGTTYNIYIYGNNIYNNSVTGVYVARGAHEIHVWSNIITDSGQYGITFYTTEGFAEPYNVYIYNNTISRSNMDEDTDNSRGGIVLSVGTNVYIKNNIFWNNRPAGAGSHYNQVYSARTPAGFDYNTYWHDLTNNDTNTDFWYYSSAYKNWTEMKSDTVFTDNADIGTDPGFTNPDGADTTYGTDDDDYTLTASTTVGTDLSQQFQATVQGTVYTMNYHDGLDPDSDWTGNASTLQANISTASRNVYQWDRGAYVYFTEESSPAPVIVSTRTDPVACPYGADPVTINHGGVTNISAYCRESTTNQTYDQMTSAKQMNGGEGTIYHWDNNTWACGQTATMYFACSTSPDDSGSESATVQIDRVIAAEEGIDPPTGITIHSDTSGHVGVTIYSDTSGHVNTTPY